MTGDMVSWDMEDIEEVKILIKSLAEVYPIYYIDGNHEHLAEVLRKSRYVSFNGFKSACFVPISDDIAESNRFDDGVWIIHVLILI